MYGIWCSTVRSQLRDLVCKKPSLMLPVQAHINSAMQELKYNQNAAQFKPKNRTPLQAQDVSLVLSKVFCHPHT